MGRILRFEFLIILLFSFLIILLNLPTRENYNGICLDTESTVSKNHLVKKALVGFEKDGLIKTEWIRIPENSQMDLGCKVEVSEKLIGYEAEFIADDKWLLDRCILAGRMYKDLVGIKVPLAEQFTLQVNQSGETRLIKGESDYYYFILEKEKPAIVNFSCVGFINKELLVNAFHGSNSSIIFANCLFQEGSGKKTIEINLDSIVQSLH